MVDFIILIIFVPLMAFIGLTFLVTAILAVYRDVLGFDDNVSEWLDRKFGTGGGLRTRLKESSFGNRAVYAGIAVVCAVLAYLFLRYGVVGLIASYVSGA
jgi:hypothetical protein